ncbi:hypothetical protein BDN72DRAFT_836900 [Pluteus cervinus]|uniref:Uncharacterized protein n=1 Tax=Pluteus cervinus TaxID=181527 RepID=A0ACD3B1W6_9AGAR|nr:hypothetical protein BDN72DRAFT_836900 [Pluteus cervinus]
MDQTFNAEAIAHLGSPIRWFTAPTFVGVLMHWFLFGALTVQVYDYSLRYHAGDLLGLKCTVYGLYFVEVVGTVLTTITAYDLVLGSWGDISRLMVCPKTSPPNVVVNNIVAFIVQIFFAWRILCLSRAKFAKIGAALTVVTSIFSAISSILFMNQYVKISEANLKAVATTMGLWIFSAVLCDTTITATMVAVLWRARSATHYQQTKTVINHLIVHTIETGGIAAVVATIELGLFIYSPHSYLHLSMFYILGRIYSNALVASVNGRHRMRALLDASPNHPCVTSLRLQSTVAFVRSESMDDSSREASSQPGFMILMKTTVHSSSQHDDDPSSVAPSKDPCNSDLDHKQQI